MSVMRCVSVGEIDFVKSLSNWVAICIWKAAIKPGSFRCLSDAAKNSCLACSGTRFPVFVTFFCCWSGPLSLRWQVLTKLVCWCRPAHVYIAGKPSWVCAAIFTRGQ